MAGDLEVRLHAANTLDFGEQDLARFAGHLDPAERARAERFVFDVHRRRFVVAHGLLREILARETGRAPAEIAFEFGPAGKPRLAGGPHFSLTHTGEHVLLAVAERELGLDAEELRAARVEPALARRVMTEDEFDAWSRAPREEQVRAFFRLWSAKESVMKAAGLGLGLAPQSFAVFAPGTLAVGHEARVQGRSWLPAELAPEGSLAQRDGVGFALALACEGAARVVRAR
jgi:4'-phosphopantetheinyl transferase